jgi:hypothetical protein
MRKVWVAVFVLFFLAVPVAVNSAEATENRVHVEGGTVEGEVSFELTSDEPLNYWDVGVEVPDGARVEGIEDSLGTVEDYAVEGETLEFRTNTGVARRSETVTVEYVVDDATVETYADGDLRVVEVGIVGFGSGTADGETTARITAEDAVFSASPDASFEVDVTGEEAVYTGEGATTVRVTVGDSKEGGYDNYAVFGDANLSEADNTYEVVPAAFGFEAPAHRHPVVVVSDTRYDEIAEGWSEAQYRPGGVILLRESASDDVGTVLHETAHGYNAEALAWSDATVGWFEEGTSRYIEFLADRRRGETRRALFVGDRIRDGEGVGPRGSFEELLGYYASDGFIRTWKPSDGDGNRRFGYAFSELIIRAYVEENGAGSLRETYDGLRGTESRTASEAATSVVLDSMDADTDVLRPCASSSRDEVLGCLRRINRMDATIPPYDGVEGATYPFEESAVPETDNETDGNDGVDGSEDSSDREEERNGIVSALRELIQGIIEFLRGLIP